MHATVAFLRVLLHTTVAFFKALLHAIVAFFKALLHATVAFFKALLHATLCGKLKFFNSNPKPNPKKSPRLGSNLQPFDYGSSALPTELTGELLQIVSFRLIFVGCEGSVQ